VVIVPAFLLPHRKVTSEPAEIGDESVGVAMMH
jgi:hypothetical protein